MYFTKTFLKSSGFSPLCEFPGARKIHALGAPRHTQGEGSLTFSEWSDLRLLFLGIFRIIGAGNIFLLI